MFTLGILGYPVPAADATLAFDHHILAIVPAFALVRNGALVLKSGRMQLVGLSDPPVLLGRNRRRTALCRTYGLTRPRFCVWEAHSAPVGSHTKSIGSVACEPFLAQWRPGRKPVNIGETCREHSCGGNTQDRKTGRNPRYVSSILGSTGRHELGL